MSYDHMPISDFELSVNATNAIHRWKSGATFGDVRLAFERDDPVLHGYLRARDRRCIRQMLFIYEEPEEQAPDPHQIIRDLLEHAVYDRERSDECIAAVEAAEHFLAQAAA